jgi:hypothetical protein
MKTLRPNDALADGWEPSPPPHIGPDGLAIGPPSVESFPPYPSLCEAGPCQHFHRFEIQVEATSPLAQQVPIELPDGHRVETTPAGKVYRPLPVFHTRVERYCYPSSGIELELGSTSMVRCNRFKPPESWHKISDKTGAIPASVYAAKVKAWKAARAQEAQEAADIEQDIAKMKEKSR